MNKPTWFEAIVTVLLAETLILLIFGMVSAAYETYYSKLPQLADAYCSRLNNNFGVVSVGWGGNEDPYNGHFTCGDIWCQRCKGVSFRVVDGKVMKKEGSNV